MISAKKTVPTESHSSEPIWSTRLSFLFGLCAFLGVLLLIFSEVGFAQDGNGFQPGEVPLGNPLNDPYLADEFEDFEEFGDDGYDQPAPGGFVGSPTNNNVTGQQPAANDNNRPAARPSAGSRRSISVGGTQDNDPGPEVRKTRQGYQLSGPGTETAIQSKNKLPALTVDTESGDGVPANSEMITDFNFPSADILDIAKTLGRLTGKNFILDKDVKGTVSIISNGPITVSDAWRAFLTALDMNQLAIVPTGKFLRIMRQQDAKGKNVRLYSSHKAPNTDALVTKIFKIKYISAKELENVIRTYANMGARIYGYEQTNTLIITDTGSNIDKVAKMIAFLDVEGFDAGIEIIQVKYASAVELSNLIDSLLPGTPGGFPSRPGFPAGRRGTRTSGGSFSARKTKEGGVINNIIADERTNTLIVHANPQGVTEVREIVNRLDRKMPVLAAGAGRIHVVYLQFADAEEMAKTLNNFSQQSGSSGGPSPFGPGRPGSGIGINPIEDQLFESDIKVSPDKTTNSLVITAAPGDFVVLQRVINKLDIPRDQIYVEVVIMEMQMSRNNEFTANLLGPKGTSIAPTNDLANLIVNPASAVDQKGLVLRWEGEGTSDITLPAGTAGAGSVIKVPNLAALLKAIQVNANTNILATPQLMTMDNTEAIFESSDKVPIPKVSNAGLGIQNTSFDYLDVPLSIKIKPQLNKISNFIKLDIKAKISDFSQKSQSKEAPATLNRSAETSVMVADSDTVVLGGLIRDKTTEVINKVPLLGDIPILGWLFKSRSASTEKSNLMLFITPKIMRQPEDVRMVLDQKLKERDEFVERSMGGEDAHREARNKIIRSLPETKKISDYRIKKMVNLDQNIDSDNSDGVTQTERTMTLTAPEPTTRQVAPAPRAIPQGTPPIPVAPIVESPALPAPPPPRTALSAPNNPDFAPIQDNRPINLESADPFATPAPGSAQ